ncbi:MAG: hypothetical protein KGN78_05045 [Actinomycetales bacterium]|nr:hypothetical protein [Actinomycetales bacterium]
MSKDTKEVIPGKEAIHSVRIRTGGVHYTGARIITTLTIDPAAQNLTGSNVVVCSDIRFHPAGIAFTAVPSENAGSHVIPYANIEVINLA